MVLGTKFRASLRVVNILCFSVFRFFDKGFFGVVLAVLELAV